MVFSPNFSGGKWKPVLNPKGITSTASPVSAHEKSVKFTFSGLTKENIKKGCFLCAHDNASDCVLYVHEDGKIEMLTTSTNYSLVGATTLTDATTGVLLSYYIGDYGEMVIGLE